MTSRIISALLLTSVLLIPACRPPAVYFPDESMKDAAKAANAVRAYDTNGDSIADFFLISSSNGRVNVLGYDTDGDEKPDELINLDAIKPANTRHLVIILDGVPFDLVQQMRNEGSLAVFHQPSRVIAPYPTTTDVCFEDFFSYSPCPAFEALYFDRRKNKLVGGKIAYLKGDNAPYNQLLDYRANLLWDIIGYVYPKEVFTKEINDAKRLFDKRQSQEVITYFVSSAGVGTAAGSPGHRFCLDIVERFILQVLWETRGLVNITLLADHGHTYTPARPADIAGHLESRGWNITEKLIGDNDVVYPRFGLETFAGFSTRRSNALAVDLIDAEGVEIVSYVNGSDVIVIGSNGAKAVISENDGKFKYHCKSGDPLDLEKILATIQANSNGYRDRDALLAATADHIFPAPLQRLWRAHFALVENPPDVIASLENDYFSGSESFSNRVTVASTHGGLNRANTTTFIMSTLGTLPPVLRTADIPRNLSELLDRKFPAGKK